MSEENKKGIPGKPKYKEDEIVKFTVKFSQDDTREFQGAVAIVDPYGTFFQTEEPSYDILVSACDEYPNGCLFKHIRESLVYVEE